MKEPISFSKKVEIYNAISDFGMPNEKPPVIIIEKEYNRDEDAYLRNMAEKYGIKLDK